MVFFSTKRLKILISAAILTGGLIFTSLPDYHHQLWLVLSLPVLSLPLTFWTLGGLRGIELITLTMLPLFLAVGASLGQYFYPNFQPYVKFFSWMAYFGVLYLLFLALNVFKVERRRGEAIPLEKAAKPAVFVSTFLTAFLLLTVIYKFQLGAALSALAVFGTVFLLALGDFWFLDLADLIDRRFFAAAAIVGLTLVQISLAFSFFPWKSHLRGLSEAVFFYAALGISRAYYEKHLKSSIVWEYILISLAVFLFARFI